MNKKNIRIIFIIVSLVLIIATIAYFTVPHILNGVADRLSRPEKTFYEEINNIASESEDIPYTVSYGSLYKGEKLISLFDLCEKQNTEYENTLCIFHNKVYYVCTGLNEEKYWQLNSLDLTTLDEQECLRIDNPNAIYGRYSVGDEYSKKNGYYINGRIVMNDFVSVWEYDMESGSITKYAYDKYTFPEMKVYGEYIDAETIKIHTENWEKTFTLNEMSQESTGISRIYSFKTRKNWEDKPYITDFFSSTSIQYINGKIYAIGECRDYTGGAYAVILEYNAQDDKWIYTTNIYTWDTAIYTYIVQSI